MGTIDWGGESVVNTTTAGDQSAPHISALSNGGWVVVWETGTVGSQTAHGQVFDAGGNKVGSELTFAGTSSEQVQVSDTNDGTFYVSWLNNPQPNNNGVITVQQFSDSTGTALGAATTDLSLFAPPPADTIGSLSMTIGPDGSDSTGPNPQEATPAIVYATSTSGRWGYQSLSGVAGETSTAGNDTWVNIDGAFVLGGVDIVATDTSTGDIEFQPGLFSPAIDVSTDIGVTHGDNAHIASLPSGESVIVFQGQTAQTNGSDIFAAVYGSTQGGNSSTGGTALITVLDVTTTLNANNIPVSDTGDQITPNVVSLGNDNIFVTWIGGTQVVGEELNYGSVDGTFELSAVGSPIAISTTAVAGSSSPSVAELADGRIVVAYESTDSNGFGIREQIIDLRNGVITGVGNNATFYGSFENSNDAIIATGQNDTLDGGNGNDELAGSTGNDTFNLGSGNNAVTGGGGLDTVHLSSVLTAANFTFINNEWVVTNGASTDDLAGISLVTDGVGDTFLLVGGGSQYATIPQAATSPQFAAGDVIVAPPAVTGANPSPPSATTADMIMRDGGNGDYEIYDIGNNAILAGSSLAQISTDWQVVGLGGFDGADTSDMILRNSGTGVFEVYDVSNNNITNAAVLGQVGLEWSVAGFGDFSGNAGETDMLMRNNNSGAFEVYDISNNGINFASGMGQVGLEWTIAGFGDFSTRANETDMLMRNSNTGAFEVYDIRNNNITFAGPMGQVGLEWTIAGFGDFSTRANETDMLMRNSNTGAFEVFDIVNNAITSAGPMGQVGLEWTIAGFGDFSGKTNETDMLMRNSKTGVFELYDISNNTITLATGTGQVGLEWSVAGVAADPPSSSAPAASTQLVQAMASYAPSASAVAASSTLDQISPLATTPFAAPGGQIPQT
jgi:hypothetical protein